MGVVWWALRFLALCLIVPFDVLTGRRRKTYRRSAVIDAPRATVWDVLTRERMMFDGVPPLEIRQVRRADAPDIFDAEIRFGDQVMHMVLRETAREPEQLIVSEVLREGTDPALYVGHDYHITTRLTDEAAATRLEIVYTLEHESVGGRFSLPLGIGGSLDRIRRLAETAAGTATPQVRAPVRAAVLTGLATLASFWWLFDLAFAVLLLVVLLLHELGHVLAMRWCGMPVRGIYFVPFMGAVAVGAGRYGNQATRGFVALMGPAASMLTTGAFLLAHGASSDPLWLDLALISIVLNVLNLIPVLPLDGGQILGALMSRLDPSLQRLVEVCLVVVAAGAAAYAQMPVTAVFAGIVLFALMMRRTRPAALAPIGLSSGLWLALGFAATIAFYVLAWSALPTGMP